MNKEVCDETRANARKKFEEFYRKTELNLQEELEEIKNNAEFEEVVAKIISAELAGQKVLAISNLTYYIIKKLEKNSFKVTTIAKKNEKGYSISWEENSPAKDMIIEYHEKLGLSFEDLKQVCLKAQDAMKHSAKRYNNRAHVDITSLSCHNPVVVKSQIYEYFAKRGLKVNVGRFYDKGKEYITLSWDYVVPHVYRFD